MKQKTLKLNLIKNELKMRKRNQEYLDIKQMKKKISNTNHGYDQGLLIRSWKVLPTTRFHRYEI